MVAGRSRREKVGKKGGFRVGRGGGTTNQSRSRFRMAFLNLLDFFADDDGVCFSDLLRAECVVVERALMLVRIAVKAAVKTATTALESSKSDFLSALKAAILFGLLAVFIPFIRGESAVIQSTRGFRNIRWCRSDDGNCRRSRF